MQISKTENLALEVLKKNKLDVFKLNDLALLLNLNKTKTYNLIKALKKKGFIEAVSSGIYSLQNSNEFVIGTYFNSPSYVSFLSALNYYRFSDNNPKKITLVSTRYKKHKKYEYICLSKKRFFGYKKEGEIVIGEREKVFVDSLLFPKYSGGIKEISRLLIENLDKLDLDQLINYSLKIESKMVLRRLGFILRNNLDKKHKEKLLKKIGKGVGFLDPNIKIREDLNKEWLLYTKLE